MSSNILLLYVNDPAQSAAFYAKVLARDPVEQSPTFALFILESGMTLGLWRKDSVVPAPDTDPGACELGCKVDHDQVRQIHDDWRQQGVTISLSPTDLDFGTSFVATDPDGHRLRVYARAESASEA